MDNASAERLAPLFAGWPGVAQRAAGEQVRALLGGREDSSVRVLRLGRCVLIEVLSTGQQIRVGLPRGC